METIWLCLVVGALAGYVVLDGFDLGAAMVMPFVTRDDAERRLVHTSIGPVWDGNEVWLVAGGATLYLAFPRLFAIGISGFYLPVMVLLWLLTFRALGIEMRHQLHHPVWDRLWDAAFVGASLLIALCLGVALGNVVRGVTFDETGRFFTPLWTHFGTKDPVGVFDVYTLLVGITSAAALALHGALWLAHRTGGDVGARASDLARHLFLGVGALLAATTAATAVVQPRLLAALARAPLGWGLVVVVLGAFAAVGMLLRRAEPERAFYASAALLVALVASAAFGVTPHVLPGRALDVGLTAAAAANDAHALGVALWWWIPGMGIAVGYSVFHLRRLPRGLTVAASHTSGDKGAPSV